MADRFFSECFRPDPDSITRNTAEERAREVCAVDLAAVYERTVLFENRQVPGVVIANVFPSANVEGEKIDF